MKLRKILLGALTCGMVLFSAVSVGAEEQNEKLLEINFQDADLSKEGNGIISGNTDNNGAELLDLDGNKVLKLGSVESENKCGVEIANGFAGHYELRQTLTQGLENTGITYNGTKADMNDNGYISYMEDRTYPYPTYTNGLTMNFWVRMPRESMKENVMFAFTRIDEEAGNGGLYMTTSGVLRFWEGDVDEEYVRNNFCSNVDGNLPFYDDGKWINLSIVIENDWISVYADGELCGTYMEDGYGYGYTRSRNFNKGFGTRGEHEAVIEYRGTDEAYKNYRDLLIGFSDEEKDAGDFSDYSKYTFLNSNGELLVDFITDENTKLYIGGDDGVSLWNMAEYTNESAKMLYDDFTFYNYPADAEEALRIYEAAAEHSEEFIEGIDPLKVPRYYPADADGDNKVGLKDVTDILKVSLGIEEIKEFGNGDVDFDGKVTLSDASQALRYALGIEKYYPYKNVLKKIMNVDFSSLELFDSYKDLDEKNVNIYIDADENYYYEKEDKFYMFYSNEIFDEDVRHIPVKEDIEIEECKEITKEYLSSLGDKYKDYEFTDINSFSPYDVPFYRVVYNYKIGEIFTGDTLGFMIDADGYIESIFIGDYGFSEMAASELMSTDEIMTEADSKVDEMVTLYEEMYAQEYGDFTIQNIRPDKIYAMKDDEKIVYYVEYKFEVMYNNEGSGGMFEDRFSIIVE